jgi:hypothetical protein
MLKHGCFWPKLGWGLESSPGRFFHWGHIPGFRAFVMGNPRREDAVVWFANSARGLRPGRLVLPAVIPGRHEAMEWLQVGQTMQEPLRRKKTDPY